MNEFFFHCRMVIMNETIDDIIQAYKITVGDLEIDEARSAILVRRISSDV